VKIGDIAGVLPEDDERLFRENISLLEDMVAANARGAASPPILAAIRAVPRHLFVAPDYRALAYTDSALPTARGLTTSAPSVIALMIHESGVRPGHRVLEVGTGTGYQAAVLSEMGAAVYSIEVDGALASAANEILVRLGYKQHASSRPGPGTNGELHRHHAPRCLLPSRGDVRLYHAVPSLEHLETLARQLRPGGRLVAPVGGHHVQQLMRLERTRNRIHGGPVEGISLDFVGMVLPQKKA
jgi:protein-L-isoaspartate(D-aspartate) O-methyltransferase